MNILYVIAVFVKVMLSIIMTCMAVRAILPWFMDVENNKFYTVLLYITEPIVIPIRSLFYRFNILQGTPIDWSFMVTYLVLALIDTLLPTL